MTESPKWMCVDVYFWIGCGPMKKSLMKNNNVIILMRKLLLIWLIASTFGTALSWAQKPVYEGGKAPVVALKTNALYWATTTPNLGLEFRLAKKWTLEAEVGLNGRGW